MNGGFSKFNSASNGGFAYISHCKIYTQESYNISNNSAFSNGGGIFAEDSILDFTTGNWVIITHNTAENNGGALYLVDQTRIVTAAESTIMFFR